MTIKKVLEIEDGKKRHEAIATFLKDISVKGIIICLFVVLLSSIFKSKMALMLLIDTPIIQIIILIYLLFATTVIFLFLKNREFINEKRVITFANIHDTITSILISLCVVYAIMVYAIAPTQVMLSSMEPAYSEGDRILISGLAYKPALNDVVIIYIDNDDFYIKRIVGMPGDTMTYDEITKNIYCNGELIEDDSFFWELNDTLTLEDNEYFVLGDNKDVSQDSRSLGPINKENIIGKVIFRFWPFSGFGVAE